MPSSSMPRSCSTRPASCNCATSWTSPGSRHLRHQAAQGLQQDLVTASEMTDRIALYDKILKAEQALDRNIQRIESIERTLSALRIDEVSVPKIEEDTRRIRAAARKLTAETDRLEKDGGSRQRRQRDGFELHDMGTGADVMTAPIDASSMTEQEQMAYIRSKLSG